MNVKKAKEKLGVIQKKIGRGSQHLDDAISLCKVKGCQPDDVRTLVYRAHEELSTAVTFLRNFDLIVEL